MLCRWLSLAATAVLLVATAGVHAQQKKPVSEQIQRKENRRAALRSPFSLPVLCCYVRMHVCQLEVHVVAHSHDDVGWRKTVDEYY